MKRRQLAVAENFIRRSFDGLSSDFEIRHLLRKAQ
jgi:hypothetical protein